MKQSVEISFIIIEYNSLDDVLKCAQAINTKCIDISYEIVVSSNSLYDETRQVGLIEKYKQIVWCFNPENKGFAYGMNKGIASALGEFIIIQNPDTIIVNDALPEAIGLLKEDKSIGLLGAQIINSRGEIQDTCRSFITPKAIIVRLFHRLFLKRKSILTKKVNYSKAQTVDWVIGAFMITSKEAIKKVGLLNDNFFMYVEDMEWCLRFWENNLKVVYYPKLIVQYEGDRKSTLGKSKILPITFNKYTYIHVKNYLIFLKTHKLKKIRSLSKKSNTILD
tara:strand:- start:72490 stop:73326 length:837 start_codon:yes stop_codon:yes gene_type:complete